MALKFSMILEAVDRASAPARKVKASVGGLVSGFRAWGQQVRKTSNDITSGARSLEFYQTRARRLRQVALGTFFRAAGEQARRFGNSLDGGIRKLKLMERAGKAAKSGLGWLGEKAAGLAKWGVAAGAAAGAFAVFDLFKTAGQFEQFQVVLEGTEGSVAKAKKAMAWVQKFAQDTPYELEDVTDAFVRARQLGIDPVTGALQTMGDAAAGNRKTLMDAVEAIGDAQTKQYERLKEFGITANTKGQQVTFSYVDKGGKNAFKAVKSDAKSIRDAIFDIWNVKYAGGMLRQSRTLFGIWNNIKDVWTGFLKMVADAGVFDVVKNKLNEWYQRLNAMSKNGQMQAWAKDVSDALSKAFDWATNLIEKTDWKAFGSDLQKIAGAAWTLAKGLADAVLSYQRWQAGNSARMAENTEKGWFSSKQAKDDARKQRQGLEREYGPLTDSGRAEAAANQRKTNPGKGFMRLPQNIKPSPAGATKIGGALDINVKVQGPGTATVQRVATNNPAVPVRARVGKVMGGPA